MKFQIGQLVWYAATETQTKYITCPDCLGSRQLKVTLGDGSEIAIDCAACERGGWQGSRGNLEYYEHAAVAKEAEITGIAMEHGNALYSGSGFWNLGEDGLSDSKEGAEAFAAEMAAKMTEENIKRAHAKEKDTRTWGWHVTYHRRCLERAQRDVTHHTDKLAFAKDKNKSEGK